jgi:hypothetical protein
MGKWEHGQFSCRSKELILEAACQLHNQAHGSIHASST